VAAERDLGASSTRRRTRITGFDQARRGAAVARRAISIVALLARTAHRVAARVLRHQTARSPGVVLRLGTSPSRLDQRAVGRAAVAAGGVAVVARFARI